MSSLRTFKTESCLVTESLHHCNLIAAKITSSAEGSAMVLQEVNLGFGIADIVIIVHNSCSIDNTMHLDKNDVSIYKQIESNITTSVAELVASTGLRKQTTLSSLNKLEALEHIESSDGLFRIKNSYAYTISHSIAIEAKLKDWKRALKQAYRYKWFASSSYVLIDEANLGPAKKNVAEFHAMGVGLMSLGLDGSFRTIYDPGTSLPIDERMTIMFNELVKKESARKQSR